MISGMLSYSPITCWNRSSLVTSVAPLVAWHEYFPPLDATMGKVTVFPFSREKMVPSLNQVYAMFAGTFMLQVKLTRSPTNIVSKAGSLSSVTCGNWSKIPKNKTKVQHLEQNYTPKPIKRPEKDRKSNTRFSFVKTWWKRKNFI